MDNLEETNKITGKDNLKRRFKARARMPEPVLVSRSRAAGSPSLSISRPETPNIFLTGLGKWC